MLLPKIAILPILAKMLQSTKMLPHAIILDLPIERYYRGVGGGGFGVGKFGTANFGAVKIWHKFLNRPMNVPPRSADKVPFAGPLGK